MKQTIVEKKKDGCKGCFFDEGTEITADDMFEELGYWLDMENNVYCIWVNDYREIIKFNKERKEFYKAVGYEQFEYITMQELQAINKKVEELGWK